MIRIEKHLKKLQEVLDEIQSALKDPKGIVSHQARLAFVISLGVATLLELYFHKIDAMKDGSGIKHEWLKSKDVKETLSRQISVSIDSVEMLDEIIQLASKIEQKRNDLAYGSPVSEEAVLLEQINMFFEIKKNVENKVGDLL